MLVRGAARAEWREGGQETSRGPEPGPGDPHVASSTISCPTLPLHTVTRAIKPSSELTVEYESCSDYQNFENKTALTYK